MCDRFFPDEPEYDIEILEWIVEEDYTVEWEYVWGVKLKEPVFLLVLGGYIERLSLAFIYERVLTKNGYDCLKEQGKIMARSQFPHIFSLTAPKTMIYALEKRQKQSSRA